VPTRNINLTPQMDKAVTQRIKRGQYANASEVIRADLRALEEDDGLPRVYSNDLYTQKCSAIFEHFYESYPEPGGNIHA
jgi:putative addiction module CopG family antidote